MLDHARQDAEIVDSAKLPMEGVLPYYERAARQNLTSPASTPATPRCGAPSRSSSSSVRSLGLDTEVVPGVSSFTAVAAAVGRELTIPEVAQSVILTRLGGGKTPMPPGEQVAEFARHGTTMALFLSAARSGQLQDELLAGGYPPDTPCVVAYQVTWPDELIEHCAAGKPGRHRQGTQALEAHAGPGRARRSRPAAPARTCTTRAISTDTARRTGRPGMQHQRDAAPRGTAVTQQR